MNVSNYINSMLDGLTVCVSLGLFVRMILKMQKAMMQEEITLSTAIKNFKKYMFLIILTTLMRSLIYVIDAYFR